MPKQLDDFLKHSKVVKLGLQNRVESLLKEGKNMSAIETLLKAEGFNVSYTALKLYVDKTKAMSRILTQQNRDVANRFKGMCMDYEKAIKDLLEEVNTVKDEARTNKDYSAYSSLVDKLYKGMELLAKLAGDLQPNKIDVKIMYNEIINRATENSEKIKESIFKTIDVENIIKTEDKEREVVVNAIYK